MDQSIIKDYVADALKILKEYPVQHLLIKKYLYRTRKAVWFVKTNKKNFALKKYFLNDQQWAVMISAYNYLSKEVNNVAPLINTKSGKLWVKNNEDYYILTNWVKGKTPDYKKQEDLTKLTQGIAKLHLAAINYQAEDLEKGNGNLGLWPLNSRRKQGLLLEYKYEAENNNNESFAKLYLKHFQKFFDLYEDVSETFENKIYQQWVDKIKQKPCLCVNGFAPHNFSLGDKGNLWLLHLDNICLDIPARDLRKLIFKSMYIQEQWSPETFSLIMRNYLKLYALTKDELKILLAELKSPHFFFNITTRFFLNRNSHWSSETFNKLLIKAIKFEQKKLEVLSRFWQLI